MKFLSSGGIGDCWIVFNKILDCNPEANIYWNHFSKHAIYKESILELMTLMPGIIEGNFHITPNQESRAAIEERYNDSIRLNTVANTIENPIRKYPFLHNQFEKEEEYIVLQMGAGRESDNSFRYFMPAVIADVINHFKKRVVLIGAKYQGPNYGAINLTAKTHVKTALEIIKSAKYVIALDGFIAYAAMSMGVPATVIYHEERLISHYLHPKWRDNTKVCVGPPRISDIKKFLP